MDQQPEGPAVVLSVEKFLVRVEEMGASKVPGARDCYEGLTKKGLTEAVKAEAATIIAAAKKEASPLPAPAIDPAEIAAAAEKQRIAYEKLNLWYKDWAGTLRAELGYHDAVKLGITTNKGGRGKKIEEPPVS
jgi:hypothetical protein